MNQLSRASIFQNPDAMYHVVKRGEPLTLTELQSFARFKRKVKTTTLMILSNLIFFSAVGYGVYQFLK